MTSREIYDAILVELNKNFGTPDLLLEDFNHFINKGIFQWVQKRYNVYDTNEQTGDDVQVLQTPAVLLAPNFYDVPETGKFTYRKKGNDFIFTCDLDDTYFHMLSCILEYTIISDFKCYKAGSTFMMPAKRSTSAIESTVSKNAWLKASYRNPYFKVESGGWVGEIGEGHAPGSKLSVNYGPDAQIDMTGNIGNIAGVFRLVRVHCDYIKYPQPVVLTYDQLDSLVDQSQVMEFKLDVCLEIVKEVVKLIALNTGNPILQSYDAVNMSVPPQGGTQQAAPQQQK